MSGRELGGTLALRRHWCRPDEPVLLCLSYKNFDMRFDVDGYDWRGMPNGAGRAVLNAVGGGLDRVIDDEGSHPPALVVHGPGNGLAAQVTLPECEETRCWVLTPYRIGIVAMLRGEAAEPGTQSEPRGGVLSRARKIAAGAAEFGRVLAGDHPYPPGEPVPLSRAAGLAEIPAAQIAHIGLDRRKLPSGYSPRRVPVLRIGLHDGSGFDVIAPDEEAAAGSRTSPRNVPDGVLTCRATNENCTRSPARTGARPGSGWSWATTRPGTSARPWGV